MGLVASCSIEKAFVRKQRSRDGCEQLDRAMTPVAADRMRGTNANRTHPE
jgi:hypothetical protein